MLWKIIAGGAVAVATAEAYCIVRLVRTRRDLIGHIIRKRQRSTDA